MHISQMINSSFFLFQSFVSSGDYDDEDDYPDLNERLESYKSKFCPGESCCFKFTCINLNLFKCKDDCLKTKRLQFIEFSVFVILSVTLVSLHFFRFQSFVEQFMEFDEDNSGDIGKLSRLITR